MWTSDWGTSSLQRGQGKTVRVGSSTREDGLLVCPPQGRTTNEGDPGDGGWGPPGGQWAREGVLARPGAAGGGPGLPSVPPPGLGAWLADVALAALRAGGQGRRDRGGGGPESLSGGSGVGDSGGGCAPGPSAPPARRRVPLAMGKSRSGAACWKPDPFPGCRHRPHAPLRVRAPWLPWAAPAGYRLSGGQPETAGLQRGLGPGLVALPSIFLSAPEKWPLTCCGAHSGPGTLPGALIRQPQASAAVPGLQMKKWRLRKKQSSSSIR